MELVETIEKINQANGMQSKAQLAMFYADPEESKVARVRLRRAAAPADNEANCCRDS
jgi:hypothetical protein